MSSKTQKTISAAIMPKPKNETLAPVVAPEVDVLKRRIRPEMIKRWYELTEWVDDSGETVLNVDAGEYFRIRSFVRLMRSPGWMGEFLREVVYRDGYACECKRTPRLTPENVQQILADCTRKAEAA